MHVGFSKNKGKQDDKSTEKALSSALDMGLTTKFGYEASTSATILLAKAEAKFKLDVEGHLNRVTTNNDVKRAMESVTSMANSDQHTEFETECKPADEDEGRAGLWQWVIATADRSAEAFTNHTVCRTGILWNTPPACNHWECANASCSLC